MEGLVKPRMLDLGVRHYRDQLFLHNPAFEARVKSLGAAGLKATLFWHGDLGDPAANSIAAYMDAASGAASRRR